MANIIEIKNPTIDKNDLGDNTIEITVRPLENGFGTTIGNALRRTLLSTLPGAAAVSVKIDGVDNEFSSIKGVKEDVTDIILNLKSVYFKAITEDPNFKKTVRLKADKPGVVTAKMIDLPSDIQVLNPEQEICTLAEDGSISMYINVSVGRGYRSSVENKLEEDPINVIHMDSIFTPVQSASYTVSPFRVGQSLNYDELKLKIKTNGTESAESVLATSAKILRDQLEVIMQYANSDTLGTTSYIAKEKKEEEVKQLTSIDDLQLSVRSINCLRRANINYLEELQDMTEEEMIAVKNLGQKSKEEIKQKLEERGLSFKVKPND